MVKLVRIRVQIATSTSGTDEANDLQVWETRTRLTRLRHLHLMCTFRVSLRQPPPIGSRLSQRSRAFVRYVTDVFYVRENLLRPPTFKYADRFNVEC